jgi:uncharacterized protein (TIGR00299 family) protein
MKTLHFDPFSGASGDMILGALVDVGLPIATLTSGLSHLKVEGFRLTSERVQRGTLSGTKVSVVIEKDAPELPGKPHAMLQIIEQSALPVPVKEGAARIIRLLADAEARVHGGTADEAHFHEVGRLDALVDIVGAAVGVHALGVDLVTCSAVATGKGDLVCSHGRLPVPSPATAALLRGVPTRETGAEGERTTPTGAAILLGLCARFGARPTGVYSAVGYGAGDRDDGPLPNLLRVFVGHDAPKTQSLAMVETNLDDISPEILGGLFDALFAVGALDVWMTPTHMKKGRLGFVVSVLCSLEKGPAVEAVLFRETSTLGLRSLVVERTALARRTVQVETGFGTVRVKVGLLPQGGEKPAPEYEDCAAVARSSGRPVREIYLAALRAYEPDAAPREEEHED